MTSTALQLSAGGNDGYLINSRSSQGYGLVIANTTTNNNGKITISNSNANTFSMTCTAPNVFDVGAGSITSTGALTASQLTLTSGANTSVLTTTANGLDVSDDVTAIAQTYNGSLVYGNVLATQGFVDLAISGNIPTLVSGLTLTVPNVTLGGSPAPVSASSGPTTTSIGFAFYFTPTQNLNSFTCNFNKAYYQGTYRSAQTLTSVCVGEVNNLQVAIKYTYNPTSIVFTGIGATPVFPNGVKFYFDFSTIIYTT